jgi:hypothetical protein
MKDELGGDSPQESFLESGPNLSGSGQSLLIGRNSQIALSESRFQFRPDRSCGSVRLVAKREVGSNQAWSRLEQHTVSEFPFADYPGAALFLDPATHSLTKVATISRILDWGPAADWNSPSDNLLTNVRTFADIFHGSQRLGFIVTENRISWLLKVGSENQFLVSEWITLSKGAVMGIACLLELTGKRLWCCFAETNVPWGCANRSVRPMGLVVGSSRLGHLRVPNIRCGRIRATRQARTSVHRVGNPARRLPYASRACRFTWHRHSQP